MSVVADQPMLARRQLRLAVMQALGPVCSNVHSPGNWPTPADKLPALLVNVPTETKSSPGRNQVQFTTTASLVIQGQATGATPEAAQDAVEALAYAVENAVLEDYWVNAMLQQFTSVQTETEITSEGKQHLAGFRMTIGCEMFEVFDPSVAPPAGSTWPPPEPAIVPLQGIDIHADTAAPYDARGTYPTGPGHIGTDFVVGSSPAGVPAPSAGSVFPSAIAPAPRVSGPDGRDEGGLQINLPQ